MLLYLKHVMEKHCFKPEHRGFYQYLFNLRDFGMINMHEAAKHLNKDFDIDKTEAERIVQEWMENQQVMSASMRERRTPPRSNIGKSHSNLVPINRFTRAGKNGKDVYCSVCHNKSRVYHFCWDAITCDGCGKLVAKADWLVSSNM